MLFLNQFGFSLVLIFHATETLTRFETNTKVVIRNAKVVIRKEKIFGDSDVCEFITFEYFMVVNSIWDLRDRLTCT